LGVLCFIISCFIEKTNAGITLLALMFSTDSQREQEIAGVFMKIAAIEILT